MSTAFTWVHRLPALLAALVFCTVASTMLPGQVARAQDAPPAAAETAPIATSDGHETVNNPYGLDALWRGGDIVDRVVLILLLIMSGSTWYIMVLKVIEQSKLFAQGALANKKFWKAATLRDGMAQLKKGSPFWYLADRGTAANEHHEGTMIEQVDKSTWITMSVYRAVDEIQSNFQRGLAVLATVGSTAPFVGLFGTVWGIYNALTTIAINGQPSIDKVAGPVGSALIMTAFGLVVAVPAVMGYNWLVRRNKSGMDMVRAFASDLHSVLLSGTRVGERAPGIPPPAPGRPRNTATV